MIVKKYWLVINENKDNWQLPYTQRYKIFASRVKAVKHAISIGYKSMIKENPNTDFDTIGMNHVYQSGDIKVFIICTAITT